ncbi:unnamed protein product, partial [Closterium sp. NIES-54]
VLLVVTLAPLSLRGVPLSPFSPLLLLLLLSTSFALRRSELRVLLVGGAATARARGPRVVEGTVRAEVEAVEEAEGVAVEEGVVAEVGASVAAVGVVEAAAPAVETAAAVVEVEAAVVLVKVEPRSVEALVVASASSNRILVRPRRLSSFRCFSRLTDVWRAQIPDAVELPRCVPTNLGIEAAALGATESAAPGTSDSVAPGAGESALSGTAPTEALHTFTLDSGAFRSFFLYSTTLTPLSRSIAVSLADPSGGRVLAHSSTVLPCPAAPSGLLSGLHLPSFSTNLVSGADLQDAWVDQFTPGGQRVTHCTCSRTSHHLATFTRRPGSSLYTLTTASPLVTASGQVASSGQVFAAASRSSPAFAPCSCRPLSHETLLWHHRLGHSSLPCLRGMASRTLVSSLPQSLPPLPPGPAPTCVPCVEGRQRAAPHSFEFPPTEAPLQTLHMDVWGLAHVRGQGHERYFLLVVDDYSRYTTVFPMRCKGEVTEMLIDWIRGARRQLSEIFASDLPVLHLTQTEEFSSDLLRAFCRAEGIRQTFTLPASPQQNGIAERRIGMVMGIARTSMIHAAAPHFLWPFAVQYAAHQINLQPRVSLPETTPTLRWTGKVGDASVFRVWGSRAFVRDTSADKLSSRAVPCVFLGFPPDAPGWQFYHPTSRRVLSSQYVTFDESVSYYHLFPYRTAPLPPPATLPSTRCSSGVAEFGGAETGGAEPERVEPRGAEPGGAESRGAEPGGAEPERAVSGGPPGVPSRREPLSPQRLREWYARRFNRGAGATGPAAGDASGAGAAGGAPGAGAAGSTGAGGAVGVVAGDPRPEGTGAVSAVSGGAVQPRPYYVPLFQQVLGLPPSTGPTPPLLSPPPVQSQSHLVLPRLRGLTERREPESRPASPESRPASHESCHESPICVVCTGRRVPRQRPPPVPGTHYMTLRPSTAPQRVPLPSPPASSLLDGPDPESDSLHAASPTVTRFLATVVTDPSFDSTTASALVAELVDFAATRRLDYAAGLVAESESTSVCPPSVGGECALGTDKQEEFECFAAALPHLVSMLLAREGDPDALDIPNPRSYAEAIEGPYSSQWQAAMDTEMASWKSTGTYVDEVPKPGANIVSGMWIFRVNRPPGSPPAFKARYVAQGFSERQGVDIFQTFSPTPKMTTLRVLLHVAAQRDYELHSLDFSTAFLWGSLHEEIWLRRPPGFTGSFPAGTQWSLRRPVYGLRQAPREWHDTLRTTLLALGFAPSTADPSLFLRTDTTLPPFYVLVHVDYLVFATVDTEALAHVKPELQKRHTCTDLGELASYLGLRITWDKAQRTITLTQSHMVQHVVQRFGLTYSLPQCTPLPTGLSLSALPSNESVEPSGPYPELVGCLMKEHMDAAKRVLRYLCSTSGNGLVLGGRARVVLTGHADALWADDLTMQRLSQGYSLSLGSGSVSWRSTRSSSVLISSCEAEIYVGSMAAQELRWLTYLLTDLGEAPRSPPVLYVDNKAMIALYQEHRLEHRMKHLTLRYFLAQELQQRGQLRPAYVATWANTADVFTKALQPCDHQRFCTVLGLVMFTVLLVGLLAGVGALVAVVEAAVGVAAVEAVGLALSVSVLGVASVSTSSVGVRTRLPSSFTCGRLHTQHRCFSCLDVAWRAEFGDDVELPRWADLLKSRIAIFDLDFDAILFATYALSFSAEGDCYRCVPPHPGIAAAALGANESSTLAGTAPAEALHTFTLDSGASRCFFRDNTTLTPLPAPVPVRLADPSGGPVVARSSTVLPSFSTNFVSTAALQEAMVTTTTPRGQCVSICQVAASCSCRLLSHQTLLWHHRLGHPSLPRLRGMHSRLLVSGLPRSLPPLPPLPAPPCLPCVEGRQRAAPHSSSFPPTTAPLQTVHMDVWGPARVCGQIRESYFLLVVDDYTQYTTVFPLRSKSQVVDVLIPWIRTVRLQLCERFAQDLPVLRLHSVRGGEFSSNLLRDFCRGEGILQSFTLPDSPQQNGIAERRIGLVMEVGRTSMIHAAAPHFLWPFAVRCAAHQLNLWPRVSFLETSPTLRWTGEVGDASLFRVRGSHAFVRDTFADKLCPRAIPCVLLGFVPDAPGWQFYHPTSRRVFPSQDVTFDESVPFYRLFPYRSAPPPPPPLFLAPGPPLVDPLLPQGPAPSGVSQIDPLPSPAPVQVAVDSGATRGAASGGAESEGAKTGGAVPGGVETGGAEPVGAKPGGVATGSGEPGGAEPEGVEPGGAASEGVESGGAGAAGAGGTGVAAGAGVTGGTATTGPGGARTRGTGAAGTGGVEGAGAGDLMESSTGGAGGAGAGAVDPAGLSTACSFSLH